MLSICVGCEKFFNKKLNRVFAKQLPQITCDTPEEEAHMCENSDCIYYFDEIDYYGCTDFIFCDKCLNDNKIVEMVLEEYKMYLGM